MAIFFPDYDHSILSLISSVLQAFGVSSPHSGLAILDEQLATPHKNTLVMVLDGLGSEYLDQLLPAASFLRSHKIADLSSVYPCTTTAATTTLSTGLSPLEHGWLGWSPWFREYGRVVDLFLDRDTFSGLPIVPSPGRLLLPYQDIVATISQATQDSVNIHRLMPHFVPNGYSSLAAMSARIRDICRMDGAQLILAYWHEPDTLMHNEGPWSEAVRREIIAADSLLSDLFLTLEDTLMVITADHGQVEVEREIFLDEIAELNDCLILPPSLETRAVSLFVKPSRMAEFAERFSERLGDSFLLLPHDEVFRRGLFGSGVPHHKVDDFIGDYLACATGSTIIRYHTPFNRPRTPFKGHHAGLRREEMTVPLIVAEAK